MSASKSSEQPTCSKFSFDLSDDSDFEDIAVPVKVVDDKTSTVAIEASRSGLQVGDSFSSYDDLKEEIEKYQQQMNVVFYKRDCVLITQSRKKGISRYMNEMLKYYSLRYHCIHGGKRFKSTSTGERSSSTFQKQCSAYVRLALSEDGKTLIVAEMNTTHNHLCSKKLYQHLPQVRCLPMKEKKDIAELLKMGANRKQIKAKVLAETGQQVLLKDLSNISARQGTPNNLQNTIKMLRETYDAECHVYEEHGVFKGLFFVTKQMQKSMDAFPEFVGIDATFKLLNIRAPVYIMIVEDSEGSTEIVAVSILTTEDADSMRWFLDMFKKTQLAWTRIRTVMADKDLLEREIIRQQFPMANVLICIFHALRTFNREITCDKLGITTGQRDQTKEIFQKMVYASSEHTYTQLYDRLKEEVPHAVLTYFEKNWHPIRHEWTLTKEFMQSNFLNTTNNRIESLNGKIKSVVKRFSTLEEFVEHLFILIVCLNSERDHKAAYNYQKALVTSFEDISPERFYSNLLTRHAFRFIETELQYKGDGEFVELEAGDIFQSQCRGSRIYSTSKSCDCPAYSSMKLPCRHIFAIRSRLRMSLCDASMCDQRWTRKYFQNQQRVFQSEESEEVDVPLVTLTSQVFRPRILSQNERYRKAFIVAKTMASLASEVTGTAFLERLQGMVNLKAMWEHNRDTVVGCIVDPCVNSNDLCNSTNALPVENNESTDQQDDTSKITPDNQDQVDCSHLQVPPVLKRRGRPKGCDKTVIGLTKKQKKNIDDKNLPFCKLREEGKATRILEWLLKDNVDAELVIKKGTLVGDEFIQTDHNRVPHSLIDDEVNLLLVKKYFSVQAWKTVEKVLETKKQNVVFLCGYCCVDLDERVGESRQGKQNQRSDHQLVIRCDYCFIWYHLPCVALKKVPKAKFWKCPGC